MQTAIIALALWIMSSFPIALLIGKVIHRCETEQAARYNCHVQETP